ncbi:hypothetical protein PYW08_015140 [Mythimna loreyi]|uniref:Uncharacterized protein n=1 Tax=Mythimna loreyi TaxID=667449 RepID=A0ACC2QUU4_9NEOP|nr:hypothetical protein PYW08_015140 [Mythimna loreyi]
MHITKNPIETHFHRLTCYHYYFFFFLFLAKLPMFWHVLNLIFLSPPMTFTCKESRNSEDQCPCDEPIWNRSVFEETMQTKYQIVCERSWLISFSQSMLYVGTLLGALLVGFMSDKYGRLPTFCLSNLTVGIAGCLVPFMPTASSFIFMRCIEGSGIGGAIVTGYVLCVEFCGTRYREMVTALYHIPINVSHMSLAGVSYVMRHCDHFQLAVSVPMFLCVPIWCLCLESPKWLMDIGDVEKATKVMEKIAKFNRKPTENIKAELEEYATQGTTKQNKVKFWQIFRHKKLTINLACMSVIYFACGMGYYGVSQYIGKMSGDIHVNVAMSGALLIPGTITTAFLLQILGRRCFLMATSFLSGIFMIIVTVIPEDATTARVLTALQREHRVRVVVQQELRKVRGLRMYAARPTT